MWRENPLFDSLAFWNTMALGFLVHTLVMQDWYLFCAFACVHRVHSHQLRSFRSVLLHDASHQVSYIHISFLSYREVASIHVIPLVRTAVLSCRTTVCQSFTWYLSLLSHDCHISSQVTVLRFLHLNRYVGDHDGAVKKMEALPPVKWPCMFLIYA